MKYYSLNKTAPAASFREATLRGQAPDKGLYFPERIPELRRSVLQGIKSFSKEELALLVMQPYIEDEIEAGAFRAIIAETIDFPFPLKPVGDSVFSLELYHGPTFAFKDVGARFMSRCLGYFSQRQTSKTTVLVATSGDTGGAVANGFLGVEGVEVVILYPSGKVSPVQELQLTTCGHNISALEVRGSFDDCQAMVKDAFMDADLSAKLQLTSANSINIARWLPQQLYYFFALQQWEEKQPPVFSVPSGNFGNLCAGLLAHESGLPIEHFIAACNVNDVVPEYLRTGNYRPRAAKPTISNAMDVGNPSNFIRMLELFQHKHPVIQSLVSGYTVDDTTTKETITNVYKRLQYLLDPHGAVAYHALKEYVTAHPSQKGIFLETAHPIKFPETVEEAIGVKLEIPEFAEPLFGREKQSVLMNASFEELKDWLMAR